MPAKTNDAPRAVTAGRLDKLWVVRTPTKSSEWGDVIYETESGRGLAQLIIGTGLDTWVEEKTALYDDKHSAEKEAEARFKDLYGEKIPAWVMKSRRASLSLETSMVQGANLVMNREAAAAVTPVRQRSQYTCMAASMMMCLKALGLDLDEDTVNKVMGARPMQGASWEQAFAAAQHFGMRTTMVVPSTLGQVKAWTDKGIPVMIAWNPEGRPWSHASVVYEVTDDGMVYVADPNIPDPEQLIRVVTKDDFYHKWFEKWPDYLVRRPAMAVEREITPDGRQVMANYRKAWAKSLSLQPDYGSPESENPALPHDDSSTPKVAHRWLKATMHR